MTPNPSKIRPSEGSPLFLSNNPNGDDNVGNWYCATESTAQSSSPPTPPNTKKHDRDELCAAATSPGFLQQLSDTWIHHTSSIGMLGSYAIAVNSLTGPAMLELPATFVKSGILPTTVTLIFVCILSALCSLHISNTISKVDGNSNFSKNVEFSDAFRIFKGRKWEIMSQLLFFVCITCLNMSSIVDTAQVVDTFLGHWFTIGGGSSAVQFMVRDSAAAAAGQFPLQINWINWDYSHCLNDDECIPFHKDGGLLITLGYIITTVFFLPLALMDLKENASWQIFGFIVLLVTSVQFVVCFLSQDTFQWDNVSMFGEHDYRTLFGVILFNFALVIAIPAWLYEKNDHVSVPNVVHGSSLISVVLYILVGALGAMAMPNVSNNMLESMMSGIYGIPIQIGASLFAYIIIGLGIPLFSVLTRYSLHTSKAIEPYANILAVYFPFFLSWMLYKGDSVTQLLSWGGVICTSFVAFILPLSLSLSVVEQEKEQEEEEENHVVVGLLLKSNDDEKAPPTNNGSIDVYYFGCLKSRKSQIFALRILLLLSILSVIAALVGNVLS